MRRKPIPVPAPAHPLDCSCDSCVDAARTLDAVRFVNEKRRATGPHVIKDWNPHDGAWRARIQW